MSKRRNNIEHTFWCINCGKQGISLQRNVGHQHSKHHRKKLYCPHCRTEVNHIECRNDSEIYEFKLNFEEGMYVNEAEESILAVGSPRQW